MLAFHTQPYGLGWGAPGADELYIIQIDGYHFPHEREALKPRKLPISGFLRCEDPVVICFRPDRLATGLPG